VKHTLIIYAANAFPDCSDHRSFAAAMSAFDGMRTSVTEEAVIIDPADIEMARWTRASGWTCTSLADWAAQCDGVAD